LLSNMVLVISDKNYLKIIFKHSESYIGQQSTKVSPIVSVFQHLTHTRHILDFFVMWRLTENLHAGLTTWKIGWAISKMGWSGELYECFYLVTSLINCSRP
jgi:hypothetical protein